MSYKHGVYGEQVPFQKSLISSLGTIPAYIGTAPIHQLNIDGLPDFDYTPYINKPILIEKYKDVENKLGYSSDWANMTLCEPIYAHFGTDSQIAPVICVNMANPKKLAVSQTEKQITLLGIAGDKTGYIDDSLACIENITLGELTSSDYKMTYENGKIKIHITKEDFSDSEITATYRQIDVTKTTLNAQAFKNALDALDICELTTGKIPNIISAPSWSSIPDYHSQIMQKVNEKIAKKWYIVAVSDIPSDSTVNTKELAMKWANTNGYTSKFDKILWPMGIYNGQKYHLSTICCVTMQKTDTDAGNVPYISPSNKKINIDGTILADGTPLYIPEYDANELNSVGITTVNIIRGELRLWGLHMANYSFDNKDNINPEDLQDSGIRTGLYLLNYLQRNYIDKIDTPITKRDIDAILASVQQWLNSLVNAGKLLYGTISFENNENSLDDIANGDFVFNVQSTTAPNAKSLTFRSQYTTEGLSSLIGGEST